MEKRDKSGIEEEAVKRCKYDEQMQNEMGKGRGRVETGKSFTKLPNKGARDMRKKKLLIL